MSKDLMKAMREAGYTEFGAFTPREFVLAVLGIEEPIIGTREDFSKVELAVLGATDYCRNMLLSEGKYLTGTTGGYRILLPSENRHQIDLYVSSANKKLTRALKLSRNSPAEAGIVHTQVEARIKLRQERRFSPGSVSVELKESPNA